VHSGVSVIKHDGRVEPFSVEKLRNSIKKALESVNLEQYLDEVVNAVLSEISERRQTISSSEIADRVEKALIERVIVDERFELAARRYLLARVYNHVFSKGMWREFRSEDLSLTYPSLKTLTARYLLRNPETLRISETPSQMFWRVAGYIASAEKPSDAEFWARKFYELLSSLKFLPNSPTLMNAGTRLGILSACFVIPVRDSIVTEAGDGIYDALRAQALVFQQGGGCGFDFSELRPEGDVVASTAGVASGPLSFMKVFDINTDVIKQGGRRRGG
jgi:ribonucleoside-diphosphate reductase alpha chain